MAVLMVLGLIRRQAIAVVIGFALTCFALVLIGKVPGVYYSQINVQLIVPTANWWENPIQNASQTLISTAGLLQRTVTIGHAAQPVSDNTTLFGIGVRHGDSVRIPNTGGQWAYNFERPVLSVEAVGSSPEEALRRTNEALAKIDLTLAQMQDQYKVPKNQQIITSLSPPSPQVREVSGSPVRAKAITLLLGTFLTLLAAGFLELARGRRRLRAELAQLAAAHVAESDEDADEDEDGPDEEQPDGEPDDLGRPAVPRQGVRV